MKKCNCANSKEFKGISIDCPIHKGKRYGMKKSEVLRLSNLMMRWHNGRKNVPFEKVENFVNSLIKKRLNKAREVFENEAFMLISDISGSDPSDNFMGILMDTWDKEMKNEG